MGVKSFLVRKAIERQMKQVPAQQREVFMQMFEENPELFEKIAKEVQEKKKGGQDEMLATMSVMKKYQSEMQALVQKIQR
ncbi:MAG: hypothetical protein OYG31_00525 [Candidatus Kaiserbacteria bacterium]|nr:hypothetical protein [Candidatus Kaiserbacteria bacterium]